MVCRYCHSMHRMAIGNINYSCSECVAPSIVRNNKCALWRPQCPQQRMAKLNRLARALPLHTSCVNAVPIIFDVTNDQITTTSVEAAVSRQYLWLE
jgi:hypothetical protein